MLFKTPLTQRYPRTNLKWLKSDEKILIQGIESGASILEISEDLFREHLSVVNHIGVMGLFEFEDATEEWAEIMGLCLAGVPVQVALDWCNAVDQRLNSEDIDELAMGDLRPELNFAREHGIVVANSDAILDLGWLFQQPPSVQAKYTRACQIIRDRVDIVTPLTLKNQVLGIFSEPLPARASRFAPRKTTSTSPKRYQRKFSKPKSYRSKVAW